MKLFTGKFCMPCKMLKQWLEENNIKVDEVILRVDLEKYSENYYLDEIKKYGDYVGSFPMAIISREIKKTLSNLTTVFSILSFVSVLIT